MTRRVWLRASALAVVVLGAVAVLTVYYSSESVPPCLVSGVPTWRPPTDGATHRFMVVFPDRAACFFDLDDQNKLVGALRLPDARGISFAAQLQDDVAVRTASGPMTLDLRTGRLRRGGLVPFPSPTLTLMDTELLRYLIKRAGQPVSRKSILEDVWNLREDTDTRAIDNFIVRLRKYIEKEPSSPKHLLTVRGVGYEFVPNPK